MKLRVKRWMWNTLLQETADYTDCGEVLYTKLAEDAALHFNHDKWLDNPDHWIWELSVDVGFLFENKNTL